jgi:hypothetical protein
VDLTLKDINDPTMMLNTAAHERKHALDNILSGGKAVSNQYNPRELILSPDDYVEFITDTGHFPKTGVPNPSPTGDFELDTLLNKGRHYEPSLKEVKEAKELNIERIKKALAERNKKIAASK